VKIILLGAAGFIGTNLTLALAKDPNNQLTVVDRQLAFFQPVIAQLSNVAVVESPLSAETDYETLVKGQDVVYHLISTTVPTTSNQAISEELKANVILSANLFEACVHQGVQKVVFISSGGTVYGKEVECPLNENTPTNPITSYGVQKITIEKLLYLYNYMHGLDYRIIRLANPYGPYQRPNGVLGAITTFTYKALKGEEIQVYGDGSVMRDFIYIDDIRLVMEQA
jgi:UDP-glucose 4-epimerase